MRGQYKEWRGEQTVLEIEPVKARASPLIVGLQSANLRVTASLFPGSRNCAVPPARLVLELASLGQLPDCLQVGRPASDSLAVPAASLDFRADD
jgi:hypothetical protein